jgi:hypothetical protein
VHGGAAVCGHGAAPAGELLPSPSRPSVTNRIHLVLFGMQNRTFGPYLAPIPFPATGSCYASETLAPQLPGPLFCGSALRFRRGFVPDYAMPARVTASKRAPITETNGMHLVLFGMQNRTFGSYSAANNRILISVMPELKHQPSSA